MQTSPSCALRQSIQAQNSARRFLSTFLALKTPIYFSLAALQVTEHNVRSVSCDAGLDPAFTDASVNPGFVVALKHHLKRQCAERFLSFVFFSSVLQALN